MEGGLIKGKRDIDEWENRVVDRRERRRIK
jgi:hypothetical protein